MPTINNHYTKMMNGGGIEPSFDPTKWELLSFPSLTINYVLSANNFIYWNNKYTKDGKTWNDWGQTLSSNNKNDIAYGNGVYIQIISAGSNQIRYSTDGINYITKTSSIPTNKTYSSMIYSDDRFICSSATSTSMKYLIYSTDNGETWIEKTLPFNPYSSLAYGNSVCVVRDFSDKNKLWVSDASFMDWISYTFDSEITYLKFVNGYFYFKSNGKIYKSSDGVNWDSFQSAFDSGDFLIKNGLIIDKSSSSSYAYKLGNSDWIIDPLTTTSSFSSSVLSNDFLMFYRTGTSRSKTISYYYYKF